MAGTNGSKISSRQIGPSCRPCRGVSSRDVQGVRMRPMKTSLASSGVGKSMVTSPSRISLSRTILSIQGYVERLDDGGPAGAIVGDELIDLGLALWPQRRKADLFQRRTKRLVVQRAV